MTSRLKQTLLLFAAAPVHGLFKPPQSFWTEFDAGTDKGAMVSFSVFNNALNTNNPPDQRDVELHPMTRSWTTATATWRTTDGVTPWATASIRSPAPTPAA